MQKIQPQIRINSPEKLPYAQIENDLKDGKHVIVQFVNRTYTDSLLSDLNKLCAKYDKSFGVRFYGHSSGIFDCAVLSKIPNVKCLYIDCLLKAENIDRLKELKELRKLSIGIYELKETEILDFANFKHVEDLIVTETKTKALNLEYLKDYKNLKFLIIGGHSKHIDAIGYLAELEFLSLNSVKKVSVSFVNKLRKLKTLSFILGSRENLNEIGENEIEHLHIVRVQGFNDLGNIERFTKLKTLLIEDQIQLKKVIFDAPIPHLEDLKIINCKTLETVSGLIHLPKLHQLRIYKTAVEFAEFIAQKFPTSLSILAFYTSKAKIDSKIENQIKELGYKLN